MNKIFLFGVFALLLASCKRERAQWDTKWAVPLVEDSLTLEQLDNQDIVSVSMGNYELAIDRNIYSIHLSDFVKIPDTTVKYAYALNVSNFNVAPGVSFVNQIQAFDFNLNPIQLREVKVKSGGISIKVESPVETATIFKMELPGVVKDGQTLIQDFTVPAGTNSNPSDAFTYVDLAGYDLDLAGEQGYSHNLLQTKLTVKSDPNGQTVSINNLDSMRFEITINDLKLDYARGYFGSEMYSDTTIQTIAALNKITSGMIDLDAATLSLQVENGFKVNAKIKLTELKSTNYEGNTVALVHPSVGSWVTVNSAYGNYNGYTPSTTSLTFDGNNSNLESFLENHGGTNEIGYQLQINPWGNTSGGYDEIYDDHPLNIKLTGNLPLNVGASDLTIVDTFDFSLNQNYDETHVESGQIWLMATNAFPLQGDVQLSFLDASGVVLTQLTADNSITSSLYGTVVNNVMQKESKVTLNCTADQVALLNHAKKICVRLVLNTPDPNTNSSAKVSIPEGAFFKFKLGAKVLVKNKV